MRCYANPSAGANWLARHSRSKVVGAPRLRIASPLPFPPFCSPSDRQHVRISPLKLARRLFGGLLLLILRSRLTKRKTKKAQHLLLFRSASCVCDLFLLLFCRQSLGWFGCLFEYLPGSSVWDSETRPLPSATATTTTTTTFSVPVQFDTQRQRPLVSALRGPRLRLTRLTSHLHLVRHSLAPARKEWTEKEADAVHLHPFNHQRSPSTTASFLPGRSPTALHSSAKTIPSCCAAFFLVRGLVSHSSSHSQGPVSETSEISPHGHHEVTENPPPPKTQPSTWSPVRLRLISGLVGCL